MLGNSNLETMSIYTHVSIEKLKKIHDAKHPGARLRPAPGDDDESGQPIT